ncbi:ARM repeat superfamily protein, partial [Striga asiatica]
MKIAIEIFYHEANEVKEEILRKIVHSSEAACPAATPYSSPTARTSVPCRWAPDEVLVSGVVIPRLAHVLRSGSPMGRQAAAWAMVRICRSSSSSVEMKKLVGQSGCIPNLVWLLEEKSNGAREVGAHAISCLMSVSCNCREVKKEEKSVPSLVALLDPSQQNTAKKYKVTCFGMLCSSKKYRKLMVSYGAIGYLKKLSEMDVPGAKKLLERLERGRLKGFFGR